MEGFLEELGRLDSRQFAIHLRKLANSLTYGTDKSPFVGSGIEFVQVRPYEAGDSVRSIDWRVTARTGKVHVKEQETPKSMPCYFLIDTSASMAIASTATSKYELALYIAGGLGLACLDRASPVGVVAVGERGLRVQPSLSQTRLLQWLLALRHFRYDERTNLAQRTAELCTSLVSRALVVVLSDLHDPRALGALRRVSQEHDCVVLELRDPAEEGLRGVGFFRAVEAETGREFLGSRRRSAHQGEELRSGLRKAGIDHLRIRTDQPFEHALRHLFRARGWLTKGAR